MPIDPSIIFRMEHARPAEYAMQGRTDRARLADYTSQVQARDFELGQRREEAGRAQSLRDLMGQYGQGGISRDDMVGQAYGIDPETARQFETHYAQLDEASRKRVRDMNDRAAALIATVSDQPSYEAALRQYAAEGGDVSEFPARYDPNHVDGLRRQVIGAKALMDQASKDRDYGLRSAEFSYRQQNDAANRGVQMRGQDITMRGQDITMRGQDMKAGAALAGQVIDTPDGPMLVDKRTGSARPVTLGGVPVGGEKAMKRESGAKRVLDLLTQAEGYINDATGSYAGAARDNVGRFFGASTQGGQNIARLRAIEGALLAEMPRMEGPQSNYDVQFYKQAVGQIGDPLVTAAEKAAAIEAVRAIQSRYAGPDRAGKKPPPSPSSGWGRAKVIAK